MASSSVIPATPGRSQHLGGESLVERYPQDPAEASGVPPELSSITEEIFFVLICSMGQLLFAIHLGHSFVAQNLFADALQLGNGEAPWVTGAFLVANGVSVVISGSLADLVDPKRLVLGAFVWLGIWNLVGTFALVPSRYPVFFVARAMSGVAVGILCSAAISMLGRVYRPGVRKNRVFALMGAMIPIGFSIGALQGGALSRHLEWVSGSTSLLAVVCLAAATWCIPDLKNTAVSLRDFDLAGAAAGVVGCGLIVFGLTQGTPTRWSPYTYALVIVGVGFVCLFVFIEGRAKHPLIDNRLWKVPGFIPLMLAYFLGYGGYAGAWLSNVVRFFLTVQQRSPIMTATSLLTVGISGMMASWVVSRLLHVAPGHFFLMGSMVAFSLGPCFFLPQTARTSFWALPFPGFVVSAFGPDMSFAALSVFVTSNVPKNYQGAAGSLLMTAQNLSTTIFAATSDTIAERVGEAAGELGGFRAVWWFALATCLTAGLVCGFFVRIPKSEEKEHVT